MKLAILYNEKGSPDVVAFGAALRAKYGTHTAEEADVIVPVGGDGALLYALSASKDKLIYGVTPQTSDSVGYNLSRHSLDDDLMQDIASCTRYDLYPMNLKVRYVSGLTEDRTVVSDFSFLRNGCQAARLNLTGSFNKQSQTLRICGDGLTFSTPLGAGGENFSYKGPMLALGEKIMTCTSASAGTPRGMSAVVSGIGSHYKVETISMSKCSMRLDIDGSTIYSGHDIKSLDISLNHSSYAKLGVKEQLHPFKRFTI